MPGVAVIVGQVDRVGAAAGQYHITGIGIADDGLDSVFWETFVEFSAGTLAVNIACKDAAIAALQAAGFTVGPADQKTLFASAVIA